MLLMAAQKFAAKSPRAAASLDASCRASAQAVLVIQFQG
jgi:hypothetical protein